MMAADVPEFVSCCSDGSSGLARLRCTYSAPLASRPCLLRMPASGSGSVDTPLDVLVDLVDFDLL